MFKDNDREYAPPSNLPDWLKEFANKELSKGGSPFENIEDIFTNKKNLDVVESHVQELYERVGLDKIKKEADKIHGGVGDDQPDERYNKEQLEKGIKIELEHTSDPEEAKEITKDHLEESKDYKDNNGGKYYDKLEDMENEIKKDIKSQLFNNLIILANKYEDNGNIHMAKIIDKTIKHFSEMFAKDKSIFEKYPKIKHMIDNICSSRAGFIDTPALIQILQDKKFEDMKLSEKDREEVKKYIKNKIKEEKKDMEDDDDTSYVVLVVDENDENDEIFSKPSRM